MLSKLLCDLINVAILTLLILMILAGSELQ
jgi:hypothetical protein